MKPAGQREKCGERDRQGVGDTERQRHEGWMQRQARRWKEPRCGNRPGARQAETWGRERERDIETWDGDMEGQTVIE